MLNQNISKIIPQKNIVFAVGIVLFLIAAHFGYIKLSYGFNFIDEGYHMEESWRITAGDKISDYQGGGILRLYTIFNSLIFRIDPEITLIGFRTCQFFMTIFAIIIFSISLYISNQDYWYLPFIFIIFAITGLDPTGMISNLSYYTYPHLFLILHLSFLILGIYLSNHYLRRLCFIISGCFLWGISFSMLFLSVALISPILLFLFCRFLKIRSFIFSLLDLIFVLIPPIVCWSIFFCIYGSWYFSAVFASIQFFLFESNVHSTNSLLQSFSGTFGYISISFIFLLLFYIILQKIEIKEIFKLLFLLPLSILMYFIIDTSCFGMVKPYYNGWLGRPMWFSAFIIAFVILFWIDVIQKHLRRKYLNEKIELSLIILLPVTIVSIFFIIFSGLKTLTVLYTSIPAMAALASLFIFNFIHKKTNIIFKLVILGFLLAPFYYTTVYADWQFTYFDVNPKQADTTITHGFGTGIKTNALYSRIYDWVIRSADKYSSPGDFMISYSVSPMCNMIAKRRPALTEPYIDFSDLHFKSIEKLVNTMKSKNRFPAIAFVFERMPMLWPLRLKNGLYDFPPKQFNFQRSQDPITRYIKQNMKLVEVSKIRYDYNIMCFVDNGH